MAILAVRTSTPATKTASQGLFELTQVAPRIDGLWAARTLVLLA